MDPEDLALRFGKPTRFNPSANSRGERYSIIIEKREVTVVVMGMGMMTVVYCFHRPLYTLGGIFLRLKVDICNPNQFLKYIYDTRPV